MVDTIRSPTQWRRVVTDASTAQGTLLGSATALLSAPVVTVNPGFNEWFNPWGALRGRQDWINPTAIALYTTVQINPPIAQYDWPVPRGARRNSQDWIQASNPAVIPPPITEAQPRSPILWRKKSSVDTTASLSTQLGSPLTLIAVEAPPPISQTDWPNPRGSRRNPQDWSDSFKLPLQQVLPPHQTDWPLPKAPRRGPQDWIQVAATFIQPPPVQPQNALYDWPVPRGPRRNPQDWSDRFKLPLQQVLPPTQKNWPLPTPAARRNPQDYIEPTNITLYTTVQIMPPNALRDWPVPKGARQPVITARDWVVGPFNPPVTPVYDPDNTLKNEIRRLRDLANNIGRIRFLKNEVRS